MAIASVTVTPQSPVNTNRKEQNFRGMCSGIDRLGIPGMKLTEILGVFGTGNYDDGGMSIDLSAIFPNEAHPLSWATCIYSSDGETIYLARLERVTVNTFKLRLYVEQEDTLANALVEPADDTLVITSFTFKANFMGC